MFAATARTELLIARNDVQVPSPLTSTEKFATVSQLRLRRSVRRHSTRPERRDTRLLIGDNTIVNALMARKKPPRKKTKDNRREGALALAKVKLTDVIAELTHTRVKTVVDDNNRIKAVRIASRYDEMCEAIEAARGGSGGKWSHQLPFWADAFVLRDKVDDDVARMHPAPEGWGKDWTPQRLAALEQHKWRPQDCDVMKKHTETLEAHVKKIDQLFAPRPIALPDPCPECGKKIVYRDLDGEKVRTPALQVDENGCTCGNCRANWPLERLRILGKIIEEQRRLSSDDSQCVETAG